MKYQHALATILLTLGLAGCATGPGYYGDRYEDGSYYSAGEGDYGDYYYAPEPQYRDYDGYYDPFFYGSPYSMGFCGASYRYCPPFWYSQFGYPYHRSGLGFSFGGGWYDPFWGSYEPRPIRHRRPPPLRQDAPPLLGDDLTPLPRREIRRPRRPEPTAMPEERSPSVGRAPRAEDPPRRESNDRDEGRAERRERRRESSDD